jgi:radical SAM superfamily enzyme YgiQ (UPF0313 family)
MRVLHVRPPKIMGALEESMVQHPVNLLYLAAAARQAGQEPFVWDFEVEPFSEKIVKDRAREVSPHLVGITCLTCNVKMGARIARWIKKEKPDVFVAVGGPHGSAIPEKTLREFPDFDAVIIGEGERTWAELADKLEKGVPLDGTPGLAHRRGEEIVVEERRPLVRDLEELPFPARDLIDHSLYRGASSPGLDATYYRSTELFSSRGCPERCIFCASKVTFGRTVRFRSPENFLAEVDECMERWGYRHFTIEDDTFTYRPGRLAEICRGLKERGVSWDCDTRVNLVSREMLFMMSESGCQKVAFGVESGSPEILAKLKKDINLEQVRKAFKWAQQAGLITTAFFIIGGHPSENFEDVEMSAELIKEIDPDLMAVAIGVPFPGTELERLMKERRLVFSEQWEKYTHIHSRPCWRTEHFSPRDLVKLQNDLFRRFFLRPHFIAKTMKKAMSIRGVRYYAYSSWQILRYLFLEKRN